MSVILASQSAVRAHLLKAAGVNFEIVAANLDESIIRDEIRRTSAGGEDLAMTAARALAREKAKIVSERHPKAVVLGVDQTLSCGGKLYEKPADIDAARASLLALRGKTHQLYVAISAMRGGQSLWQHSETVRLVMRDFSDEFLEDYLKLEGPPPLLSYVGAYALEGRGSQLFKKVEGDYFSVLGIPLLPLLAFLRAEGELAE